MIFRNKKRSDKSSAVAKKNKNERKVAMVHLTGDLSGIYSSLYKKNTSTRTHVNTYADRNFSLALCSYSKLRPRTSQGLTRCKSN